MIRLPLAASTLTKTLPTKIAAHAPKTPAVVIGAEVDGLITPASGRAWTTIPKRRCRRKSCQISTMHPGVYAPTRRASRTIYACGRPVARS